MTRPKILHLSTTDITLDLLLGPQLEAFAHAGYDVVAASAPGPHVAAIEARGIRHIPLENTTRAMDPRRDLAAVVELVKLFRVERPDLVHTHNPKPGWYGRLAGGMARVPAVVNTVHGLYASPDDRRAKRWLVYALERGAACFSDAELVQNEEDVVVLRRLKVPARKVTLLGNGIDLGRFDPATHQRGRSSLRAELGAESGDLVVGVVGRLVWEKGLREVLDAAASLRRSHPRVRFVIVGPTDDAKSDGLAQADLAGFEAETGVHFAGARSDMESVYAAFDLLVLASHREGFPRAVMEAAAMGLPVVATDIRGCRQAVAHRETGILVPVRDGEALASAVAELADHSDLRVAYGAAAVAKARREFDQQTCIDITLATYERLLPGALS